MGEASAFVAALRAASEELRLEPHEPVRLNQAAARIDQLGRRVHGLGWTRDHEIGGCLTAAVWELSLAQGLPAVDRAATVRQALGRLDEALAHTAAGLRPQQAEPVTALAAREGTRDHAD